MANDSISQTSKFKRTFFYIILFVCLSTLLFYNFDFNLYLYSTNDNEISAYLLKSRCLCHDEIVEINRELVAKTKDNQLGDEHIYDIQIKSQHNLSRVLRQFRISASEFRSLTLTCDLYSSLKRGRNQKVISFSLYGKFELYYAYLTANMIRAKELMPDWTIRVYHDGSINKSIICERQCLRKNITGELYDNIDFCDIEKIPIGLSDTWNAAYMIPKSWRWLPFGDNFVDLFISRDTDSCINRREHAALFEWTESNTLFHIMRDHPSHRVLMLAGMWGFFKKKSDTLAKYFYNLITSRFISFYYKTYIFSKYDQDQMMLREYFWPIARKNATIHDSFYCKLMGGRAFPTKRVSRCHVGFIGCCDETKNETFYECPVDCRPPDHKNDWTSC